MQLHFEVSIAWMHKEDPFRIHRVLRYRMYAADKYDAKRKAIRLLSQAFNRQLRTIAIKAILCERIGYA